MGIQFTPQLFSTVSIPTVTISNHHQMKYEVNNPKDK